MIMDKSHLRMHVCCSPNSFSFEQKQEAIFWVLLLFQNYGFKRLLILIILWKWNQIFLRKENKNSLIYSKIKWCQIMTCI